MASKTIKIGRDPFTGEFIPLKKALTHKKYIVENVPKKGFGDTQRRKKR